jgi:hypothetical protein
MRNVAEYPVTADEVMRLLESIPQVNPPGTPPEELRIGGIDDMVRRHIIDYFRQQPNMDALLQAMKI